MIYSLFWLLALWVSWFFIKFIISWDIISKDSVFSISISFFGFHYKQCLQLSGENIHFGNNTINGHTASVSFERGMIRYAKDDINSVYLHQALKPERVKTDSEVWESGENRLFLHFLKSCSVFYSHGLIASWGKYTSFIRELGLC